MSAVWLVAAHHLRRVVLRRSYLITVFSLPLFLVFIIGMSWFAATVGDNSYKLGVVDPGGFLEKLTVPGRDDEVEIRLFDSQQAAVNALQSGAEGLDGIYLLPQDYPSDLGVELIVEADLDFSAQSYFYDLLRINLLDKNMPELAGRVIDGSHLLVRATEAKREFPASNPTADLFFPVIAAAVFVFTIFPITGIMVGALGEEKVNRTIEVLITSISPRQLIGGKVLAVTGIALLQIVTWSLFLAAGIWLGGNVLEVSWLQGLEVPWRDIGAIAILALPGFLFYGASLVLIGSLIDDQETLQQVGGLMTVPLFLPLYVIPAILQSPDGTISLIFSFLPFTNVLTTGLLSIFQEVPAWRVAISALISLIAGLGIAGLAGRAFRIGMLRYGKRIRMRELFSQPAGEVKL